MKLFLINDPFLFKSTCILFRCITSNKTVNDFTLLSGKKKMWRELNIFWPPEHELYAKAHLTSSKEAILFQFPKWLRGIFAPFFTAVKFASEI